MSDTSDDANPEQPPLPEPEPEPAPAPPPNARYFAFTGLIDPNSATRLAAALNLAVNDNFDEVHISVSSHGGHVADGIFLFNHIRSLPIRSVFYNTGSVSSIAVAAFVGADERHCSAHSMFLIHPTWMGASEGMTAERLQGSLAAALADDDRTESILRERATIPDQVLSQRRFKDVYITPEDARSYGIVSSIREFSVPDGIEIIQV